MKRDILTRKGKLAWVFVTIPALLCLSALHVTGEIIESGPSAGLLLDGDISYTTYIDAERNVSFTWLGCNVSGTIIEAAVSVWDGSDYSKLKRSTGWFSLVSGFNNVTLGLPYGRYANLTIRSSSQWGLNSVDMGTSTKPRVSGIRIYDANMVEGESFGRETITIVAEVLSPGGSGKVNYALISIRSPDSVVKYEENMRRASDIEDGAVFDYQYTIHSTGRTGTWTVNVTGYDDGGMKDDMSASFTVRVPPTAGIKIYPSGIAYEDNDIICEVRPVSEVNEGELDCAVSWYKNDVNQTGLFDWLSVVNGTKRNVTLGSGNTSTEETWKCVLVVDDGTETSGLINSTEKLIMPEGFTGCTDSDGGVVKDVKGHAIGMLENGSEVDMTDTCVAGTKTLKEYYCKDIDGEQRVAYQTITCQYHCGDGRCVIDYDGDLDGYSVKGGDCDDNDPDIHPGVMEICNDNKDNDCDGTVDEEGCGCKDGDTKICGSSFGICVPGYRTCTNHEWSLDCIGGVGPQTEICDNGLDDDCDGDEDEVDCVCRDGDVRICGSSVGECRPGQQTCSNGVWGGCIGRAAPKGEVCNGLDDDCDGEIDNDCVGEEEIEDLCSNGVQDLQEEGIDCGGVCPNKCPEIKTPPEGQEGTEVELWLAVAAIGLLIMGATGVFVMFSKKPTGV